jgi:hypothetical protein
MVRGELKQASFQGNSCFIKNKGYSQEVMDWS